MKKVLQFINADGFDDRDKFNFAYNQRMMRPD